MPVAQPLLPLPRRCLRAYARAAAPSRLRLRPDRTGCRMTRATSSPVRSCPTGTVTRPMTSPCSWPLPQRPQPPCAHLRDRPPGAGRARRLELTEARVRGAIRVLEEVGYIDRAVTRGSPYQPTPEGLRRKPVEFQFSAEYVPLFVAANRRAAAARERRLLARPLSMPVAPLRPSTAPTAVLPPGACGLNSPKNKLSEATVVYLGEIRTSTPSPPHNPALEAALDRWKRAAEKAGVLKGEP